ncbi:ATP-dependent helicase fft2 [Drechslerella dactyloides]|uniref:DNA helicase n=1 Tax=Drechslerella dactyloides TaxID=74499 RepID=A0AAD6NGX0_DREDA|nr:ATP-dependent helicase fft2 [Drechslerella dactyloides]
MWTSSAMDSPTEGRSPKRVKWSEPEAPSGLLSDDATMPVSMPLTFPLRDLPGDEIDDLPSSPPATIPTQIIGTPAKSAPVVIQVAASSPVIKESPIKPRSVPTAALPAAAVETPPARRPYVIKIDLDDDTEVPYAGISSDEEEDSKKDAVANSAATTFYQSRPTRSPSNGASSGITLRVSESPVAKVDAVANMRSYAGQFTFNASKRHDWSAAAKDVANMRRNFANAQLQNKPSLPQRAPAVPRPTGVIDLTDASPIIETLVREFPEMAKQKVIKAVRDSNHNHERAKLALQKQQLVDWGFDPTNLVPRVKRVYPALDMRDVVDALIKNGGAFDKTIAYLADVQSAPEVIVLDDDFETSGTTAAKRNAQRQPKKTIREKFSNHTGPTAISPPAKPAPTVPSGEASATEPTKPRRRLVSGRKLRQLESSESPETVDLISSDEEVGAESQSGAAPEERTELDILSFINSTDVAGLVDLSFTDDATAELILAQRPFASLEDVRGVADPNVLMGRGKNRTPKVVGDRVVDQCLETWQGFLAVDSLLQSCQELGDKIKEGMKGMGVEVGAADSGEGLDIVAPQVEAVDGVDPTLGGNGHSGLSQGVQNLMIGQPKLMSSDITLKPYQVLGVHWLKLLHEKELGAILADEMGLGKTCQVIAFLALLLERGVKGPHIVVVPPSTLENWLREFQRFCPALKVEVYYGNAKERMDIRNELFENGDFNVIVTTYNTFQGTSQTAKLDRWFLRKYDFNVAIFDEGHQLKNSSSNRAQSLATLKTQFRVLLTGTPLQNNLQELMNLLAFILPQLFEGRNEQLSSVFRYKATTADKATDNSKLLSYERVRRAKAIMTPFVLRRRKLQVLKDLPKKFRTVIECELTPVQAKLYQRFLDQTIARAKKEDKKNARGNMLMKLRQAAIHPLLVRDIYSDSYIGEMAEDIRGEPEYNTREHSTAAIQEDMCAMTDWELHQLCMQFPNTLRDYRLTHDEWMDSAKVVALKQILSEAKAKGDRVLIFSQFTTVLDILERVLQTLEVPFLRLDGSTHVALRQDLVDQFEDEQDITAFLLSTKAGGVGLNLAAANRVVIFDSSFNPFDDLQAEDRAWRIGQTRDVQVSRLVAKGTVEEAIQNLANTKLMLDASVSSENAEEDGERFSDFVRGSLMKQIFNNAFLEKSARIKSEKEEARKLAAELAAKEAQDRLAAELAEKDRSSRDEDEDEEPVFKRCGLRSRRQGADPVATAAKKRRCESDSDDEQEGDGQSESLNPAAATVVGTVEEAEVPVAATAADEVAVRDTGDGGCDELDRGAGRGVHDSDGGADRRAHRSDGDAGRNSRQMVEEEENPTMERAVRMKLQDAVEPVTSPSTKQQKPVVSTPYRRNIPEVEKRHAVLDRLKTERARRKELAAQAEAKKAAPKPRRVPVVRRIKLQEQPVPETGYVAAFLPQKRKEPPAAEAQTAASKKQKTEPGTIDYPSKNLKRKEPPRTEQQTVVPKRQKKEASGPANDNATASPSGQDAGSVAGLSKKRKAAPGDEHLTKKQKTQPAPPEKQSAAPKKPAQSHSAAKASKRKAAVIIVLSDSETDEAPQKPTNRKKK